MSTLVCFYEEGQIQYATIVSDDLQTAATKLKEMFGTTNDGAIELEDDRGLNLPTGAVNVVLRNDDPNYDRATVYAVLPFSEANAAAVLSRLSPDEEKPFLRDCGLSPV